MIPCISAIQHLRPLRGGAQAHLLRASDGAQHFLDTIKLISYRTETSMASLLRESLSREDDTRALLRQIYSTEADLLPDVDHKTLTVRLHHLTQAAHDQALLRLCDELNATETIFPGTDLRLIYKLGSC